MSRSSRCHVCVHNVIKYSPVLHALIEICDVTENNNHCNKYERKIKEPPKKEADNQIIIPKELTIEERNKLIIDYIPLVKKIAARMKSYIRFVEFDDLFIFGIFGLIDAIDKYDPNKKVKFSTYAGIRIRGSIIDEIRKLKYVDMDPIDDFVEATIECMTDNKLNKIHEEYLDLYDAINRLTKKEKSLIILHYFKDMTLKDISVVLNISPYRVSQIHLATLRKLRVNLDV